MGKQLMNVRNRSCATGDLGDVAKMRVCDVCGEEVRRLHYIVERSPYPRIVNTCYFCLEKKASEEKPSHAQHGE